MLYQFPLINNNKIRNMPKHESRFYSFCYNVSASEKIVKTNLTILILKVLIEII